MSFCAHALLTNDALVIPDALLDERFHDNPLVTGAPGIRFYAGQPLSAPNGARVGTLCLIDTQPRSLDRDAIARLGGDEFVVPLSATDAGDADEPVERVARALAARNAADARGYAIRFSAGHVAYDPTRHHSVSDLLASADRRMYEHKRRGKAARA